MHCDQSYFRVGDIAALRDGLMPKSPWCGADPDFDHRDRDAGSLPKDQIHMTQKKSSIQRGDCLEHCKVTAWTMELMEYHITRGRVMLMTQKEQNKF